MPDVQAVETDTMTFESMVTPLLKPAYAVALSLSGSPSDAEDLVQEAALHALRGFGTFEPGTNFKAWFFRILTNCFYATLRQRRRRPQTVDFDDLPELYLYARTAEAGWHAASKDPARDVMDRMTVEQVRTAIEGLPEEYRIVAALYFIEDFTYEDIAQVLRCPLGTVRSRLHRGRKMLQKVLWRIAEEEGIARPETAKAAAAGAA